MSSQLTPVRDLGALAPANNHEAPPPIGNLAGALAAARDKCKAATKDARNTHHGYRYASADEVVATASEALNGSGLGLIPLREELTVSGSGNLIFYALNRHVLLAHSSGESLMLEVRGWPVIPERGRPLDKAYAIALTSSLAYKLRDLLQMPRGDTSDDVAAQKDRITPATPPPQEAPINVEPSQEAPANPPTAPQANGDSLTEQEYQDLVSTARANKRTTGEVAAICAAVGVRMLQQAPRERRHWLGQALTTGLTPTPVVDRINQLRGTLGLDPALFSARLSEVYGVSSIAHLLPAQANELETKLKAKLQPAAAPA